MTISWLDNKHLVKFYSQTLKGKYNIGNVGKTAYEINWLAKMCMGKDTWFRPKS